MRYRRNADADLRALERSWQTTGGPEAQLAYLFSLLRAGQHPYWMQIRERMARRNTVYYDSELRTQQQRWFENQALDPMQDVVPEPEVYIKDGKYAREEGPATEGILRWEEREPYGDKVWEIEVYIPMSDGSTFVGSLGKITAQTTDADEYLQCTVESHRNLYRFDYWQNHPEEFTRNHTPEELENESARANMALAGTLTSYGDDALFDMDVPVGWNPLEPYDPSYRIYPMNTPAYEGGTTYRRGAKLPRENDPEIVVPDGEFYIPQYLLERFLAWLEDTTTFYGERLREACTPLGPQLPVVNLGLLINLHYWLDYNDAREIDGTDNPNDPEYQQHRFVYEAAYRVDWSGDFSARFYRYDHDPGHADPRKLIRASEISYQVPNPEVGDRVLRKSQRYLKNKIDQLISVAEKYGYHVNLIEGKPLRYSKPSTWKAGLRYPLSGFAKKPSDIKEF